MPKGSAANAALAAGGNLEQFLRANLDWHIGVATAGHNEILTGIMIAPSRAIYAVTHSTPAPLP